MPETRRDRSSKERIDDSSLRDLAPGILESHGERVLVLPPSFVVNIQKQLESTVGISARGFLYLAGARSGKAIAENLLARSSRPDELLREALELLSGQGWGRFALAAVDSTGSTYFVTLVESAIASSYGPSKKPVCHLIAGWIAGIAEELVGQSLTCDETSCKAQGRPRCEFEIRPTPYV